MDSRLRANSEEVGLPTPLPKLADGLKPSHSDNAIKSSKSTKKANRRSWRDMPGDLKFLNERTVQGTCDDVKKISLYARSIDGVGHWRLSEAPKKGEWHVIKDGEWKSGNPVYYVQVGDQRMKQDDAQSRYVGFFSSWLPADRYMGRLNDLLKEWVRGGTLLTPKTKIQHNILEHLPHFPLPFVVNYGFGWAQQNLQNDLAGELMRERQSTCLCAWLIMKHLDEKESMAEKIIKKVRAEQKNHEHREMILKAAEKYARFSQNEYIYGCLAKIRKDNTQFQDKELAEKHCGNVSLMQDRAKEKIEQRELFIERVIARSEQ